MGTSKTGITATNWKDSIEATRMISANSAPSNLAIAGRYVFTPEIFDFLEVVPTGVNNEIQLTDAIAAEIGAGRSVHALRFRGQRFDCGSKAGFLQATVSFALARPELQDEFAAFLRDTVPLLRVAE